MHISLSKNTRRKPPISITYYCGDKEISFQHNPSVTQCAQRFRGEVYKLLEKIRKTVNNNVKQTEIKNTTRGKLGKLQTDFFNTLWNGPSPLDWDRFMTYLDGNLLDLMSLALELANKTFGDFFQAAFVRYLLKQENPYNQPIALVTGDELCSIIALYINANVIKPNKLESDGAKYKVSYGLPHLLRTDLEGGSFLNSRDQKTPIFYVHEYETNIDIIKDHIDIINNLQSAVNGFPSLQEIQYDSEKQELLREYGGLLIEITTNLGSISSDIDNNVIKDKNMISLLYTRHKELFDSVQDYLTRERITFDLTNYKNYMKGFENVAQRGGKRKRKTMKQTKTKTKKSTKKKQYKRKVKTLQKGNHKNKKQYKRKVKTLQKGNHKNGKHKNEFKKKYKFKKTIKRKRKI
jgi:hypothetical protein